MSSFLEKEALCVCRNKLVIVLDCGSSIYHVTIKMMYSRSGCVGCWLFCLSCDECSLRCAFSGSMLVSLCKCWMFVSDVHPVAILSAMF